MDPNETLDQLRRITLDGLHGGEMDAEHMANLFDALDEWMTRGGFLPTAWSA